MRGDFNNDGKVDITDIVYMAKYLAFGYNLFPISLDDGDFNNDGNIDISDLVYLAKHIAKISGYEKLGTGDLDYTLKNGYIDIKGNEGLEFNSFAIEFDGPFECITNQLPGWYMTKGDRKLGGFTNSKNSIKLSVSYFPFIKIEGTAGIVTFEANFKDDQLKVF
mgnify:CR=1 FL=1|tara:strand:- start:11241 stop:11732 length:492 start_codon:yes stop_codon:yes gene_type:complete